MEMLVKEKEMLIEESKRRHTSLESEIRAIQDELEKERKKSMLDEATIKKLETLLKRRVQELDAKNN